MHVIGVVGVLFEGQIGPNHLLGLQIQDQRNGDLGIGAEVKFIQDCAWLVDLATVGKLTQHHAGKTLRQITIGLFGKRTDHHQQVAAATA